MRLLKTFLSTTLLLLAVLFSGCQGNGDTQDNEDTVEAPQSTETASSIPLVDTNQTAEPVTVTLPVSNATLTKNAQSFAIVVKAIDSKNRPYLSGNIEIVFPNDVKDGRDIGYFDKFISPLDNKGVATFIYTAPASLDENTSDIQFGFFHENAPTNVLTYTMKILPDVNQTVNTTYKIITNATTDVTMLPEDMKSINYSIVNKEGVIIADNKIKNITVTTLNPNIATLQEGDSNGSTLSFSTNNISLNVISRTLSGIVPIQVNAVFDDENSPSIEQNLTQHFNIIVLSGPPSAISISYNSTKANPDIPSGFTENWILKVTDKYNNIVNTNPSVSMGLIVGYAIDSSGSNQDGAGKNYLYFQNGGTLNGTLNNFTVTRDVFNNSNLSGSTDVLVTFGDGYTYEASGKWDFSKNNGTTLDLIDTYSGNTTTNLGFAVGHNYRQDPEGGEAIATVKPKSDNYLLNKSGYMTIEISYDYYLTGKDVVLWVNLIGEDLKNGTTTRIGEAKKITLRAHGLKDRIINIPRDINGTTGRIFMEINVPGSDIREVYRDANFGCNDIKFSDNLKLNGITTSNGSLNGPAFIEFNVTDTEKVAGTITLTGCAVAAEF